MAAAAGGGRQVPAAGDDVGFRLCPEIVILKTELNRFRVGRFVAVMFVCFVLSTLLLLLFFFVARQEDGKPGLIGGRQVLP